MKLISKFSLFLLTAMLATNPAHSNGFVGINLGAAFVNTNKTLVYPYADPTSYTTAAKYTAGYPAFHGQLLGGYDFLIQGQLSLALEGDFDAYANNSNFTVNNYFLTNQAKAEEQLRYGFSLFLLPNYHLSKRIALFLGPGVSTTQFRISSAGATGGDVGITGPANTWLTGWGFKTGAAINLSPQIDLLLSYQFTDYTTTQQLRIEPLSSAALRGQYQPYANSVMLGLIYLFR